MTNHFVQSFGRMKYQMDNVIVCDLTWPLFRGSWAFCCVVYIMIQMCCANMEDPLQRGTRFVCVGIFAWAVAGYSWLKLRACHDWRDGYVVGIGSLTLRQLYYTKMSEAIHPSSISHAGQLLHRFTPGSLAPAIRLGGLLTILVILELLLQAEDEEAD